jgi:hypothetical protein
MTQITSTTYRVEPSLQAVMACRTASRFALWSVLLCAAGQLLIDASGVNVICVLIVATISAVTFYLVIRGSVFRMVSIPALIVLGFNISTMSGALIAQTLSLRSLVYNLKVPTITFALCALFQISLLVALYIFLSSHTLRTTCRTINQRVFVRLGNMQAPMPGQLWLMGLVGCVATLLEASYTSGNEVNYGDVGGKFLAGLLYFAFAPFLIPILDKVFPSAHTPSTSKASNRLLFGYAILLVFLAVVRNSRATFMMGIANLGMAAILLMLIGQLRVTARLRRGLIIGAVMTLMVAPLAADLAIAMEVVRGQRTEVFGTDLVALTLDAFNDKPTLEQYRKEIMIMASAGSYDENYLANTFMGRFVNTKFFDNTLSYEDVRAGAYADSLWSVTLDKIGALLPTPLLRGLGIDIDKENLKFSIGDALYDVETGNGGLGGYKTGSPIGHGMGLMGYFVFIAAVPLFVLVFMAMQSLTLTVGSFVVISPLILLQLMSVFGLAAGDSLLEPISLMLRTLPQNILIYWMVFQGTHWAMRFLPNSTGSRGPV